LGWGAPRRPRTALALPPFYGGRRCRLRGCSRLDVRVRRVAAIVPARPARTNHEESTTMHDRTTHDRTPAPRPSLLARWLGGRPWAPAALAGSLMAGALLVATPAAAAAPDDARHRAGARVCAEIECTDAQREQLATI